MRLIIVTGLSGSGKSIALNTLEDLGHYCVDNLPASLLEPLAERLIRDPNRQDYAVGIDARNMPEDLHQFPGILARIQEYGIETRIVYLDAELNILLKRFSETRRKHPLTQDDIALPEAINKEKELLTPISGLADIHLDTTRLNLYQLRDELKSRLNAPADQLSVTFESFGFKHGAPVDADFMFDVRCLPNPHWDNQLRPLTGQDTPVADFLEAHDSVHDMFEDLKAYFSRWIPEFAHSNRSYITVAIGCTGGQHRSVYMTERLAQHFASENHHIIVRHRELA